MLRTFDSLKASVIPEPPQQSRENLSLLGFPAISEQGRCVSAEINGHVFRVDKVGASAAMDQLVELFYAKFSADVARFQAPNRSTMILQGVHAFSHATRSPQLEQVHLSVKSWRH